MATFSLRTQFQHIFQQINYGSATLTVTAIAATSVSVANTIAVPNAQVGDIVDVSASTAMPAGLTLTGEVISAGVVALKFTNPTASSATPTASTLYRVLTYTLGQDFSS